jgi:hypothetical protein
MKSTLVLRKLRSAARLSSADWLLFIQAWIWLLLFDIGLRTRPFPELQAFAAQSASHPPPAPEQTERLLHITRVAVDRARYNHLYPMTCLRRSLTLQKMLAKRWIAAELKIGVRKDDGQLEAHAWLEYQGRTLGEAEKITEKFSALEKSAGMHNGEVNL